jgi:hypothetical protein
MQAFQKAAWDEVQTREAIADAVHYFRSHPEEARRAVGQKVYTTPELLRAAERIVREELSGEVYVNDLYQVIKRETPTGDGWPPMWHLSIRRRDRKAVRDWRHFQEIKNRLIGPDHEGVELYPAESHLLDAANQYHLYVLKEPGVQFPFGYRDRNVSEESFRGSRQRPFAEGKE